MRRRVVDTSIPQLLVTLRGQNERKLIGRSGSTFAPFGRDLVFLQASTFPTTTNSLREKPSSLGFESSLSLCAEHCTSNFNYFPSSSSTRSMATSLPSTPKATPAAAPSAGSDTPGKWRHPQLSEVVRRQNAATFGDKDLRKAVWNASALVLSWFFGSTLKAYSRKLLGSTPLYSEFSLLLLQLFFLSNIFVAFYPLLRRKDDLADIPLTPTQRALLGLDPNTTPPLTPSSSYVTPPRYRASTSRKASPASRSSSPLNSTPSFSDRRVSSGPTFSPLTSPLLHKAVANGGGREPGRESGRRQSIGSTSPLARSNSFGESSIGPSTPSPLSGKGKRTSLGLSNKWLYERSRRLSTSNGAL
ncbi:hypothetical protein N7468_007957 [Penicillium chermesinum]|uniref:Nuclear pore complex component n=1 Tax=Penicillium chermesinum TaxID=63820 RepID=A0A9W9TJE2_9EURO|nr:uncharacterized protein N7468_007957 [Penicillium chermesinum]KAJ5223415.1 hypothetical protein N7468_007957 [Penicillium chermesinum]